MVFQWTICRTFQITNICCASTVIKQNVRKGSGRNFFKLTNFLEISPFRNMAVSPLVLAPEQPNLYRINGFFLENPLNTLDLSYGILARDCDRLKEKFAIF